jgi:hypothetical protein
MSKAIVAAAARVRRDLIRQEARVPACTLAAGILILFIF